jgi:hypothetical protein
MYQTRIFLLLFALLASCGNKKGDHAQAPGTSYTFPIPEGWNTEQFPLPPGFAPQIHYTGTEEIRFAPGWAKSKSNEYWSYAFLWHINGIPGVSEDSIETLLTDYYTGLAEANLKKPVEYSTRAQASFGKTETHEGDVATYKGSIRMLDYIRKEPLTLNCIVHVKSCQAKNETFMLFLLSPKSVEDSVWQKLNSVSAGFDCNIQ